jgi:hypothetical protein
MTDPYLIRAIPPFITDVVVDVPEYGACNPADIWEAWQFAHADAEQAWRAWTDATPRGRRELHVAYVAALDREEQAAVVLAAVLAGGRQGTLGDGSSLPMISGGAGPSPS